MVNKYSQILNGTLLVYAMFMTVLALNKGVNLNRVTEERDQAIAMLHQQWDAEALRYQRENAYFHGIIVK